ncbi:phage major capsid protein [Sphingomonas nostoxanthinifaciens]|uniref:phage major capsid protein n=1 Tax=Sphingomonas nostoxanthinifaciens TaxID=2872652 RepID=UPI001CC1E479|nr:phage major capsid protein [Sphingomonas nostoxanthinifaciens]UAK25859.1 phage major capsid protein [Sphingomonas nostoxanthinifaciens]
MSEHKTVTELAEDIKKDFDGKLDKVKGIAEQALGKLAGGEELSKKAKELADEAITGMNTAKSALDEIKTRIADLEQKATRPGGGGAPEIKGYGQQLAESEKLKSFVERGAQGSTRIELKAITTSAGSAGGMIVSQRETEIVGIPKRPDIILRDLLTVVPIATGSVDYPKQTTRTNAAAPVPEGTTKPYSNYGWSRVTANVRTLAHLAKLTKQALDDAPRLQAEVDAEMRYGLALAEDAQILLGDGTGENLYGLMPQATAYALPAGATAPANQIDKLRAAVLQAILAYFPPDGIVLNPIDWYNIEITKDAAGGYIFANPQGVAGPVLWGKPVAQTVSMTVGAFLTGAFKLAATLYDRETVEVLISSENADDFEKNLLTMRAEERLALAVKRSAALIKGTF